MSACRQRASNSPTSLSLAAVTSHVRPVLVHQSIGLESSTSSPKLSRLVPFIQPCPRRGTMSTTSTHAKASANSFSSDLFPVGSNVWTGPTQEGSMCVSSGTSGWAASKGKKGKRKHKPKAPGYLNAKSSTHQRRVSSLNFVRTHRYGVCAPANLYR